MSKYAHSIGMKVTISTSGGAGSNSLTTIAGDLDIPNGGFALGSDASGDMYYRNGSGVLTRIAVGSDNHVLTLDGVVPGWEAASGGGGGISFDGSTANGILTYKDSDEATVEANLTYDGSMLTMTTGDLTLADGSVNITDADNAASLSVTNNTITTANALINVSSTSITTGAMMTINANTAAHDGEILELINAGDATSTGTGLSITMPSITTGAAKGIDVVMAGATSTAKGISVTMDAITTGDMLYLDNGGGTMTGDGKFINCNDDDTSVFSVATGGLTTIAGPVVNSFTTGSAITNGTTITVDFSTKTNFSYLLDSSATITMGAPSNATSLGQSGNIIIITGSSGTNTVNWASGSYWYFEGGSAPTITQSQSVYDIYSYLIVDTNKILITSSSNFIQG